MLLNPRIQKAIYIATHQHRDQKRKIKDLPYIVHPFSVAWLLSEYTNDEDTICAALLHDVIEDTEGYSFENMETDFGKKVVQIVKDVTEDKSLPWQERKEKYIDHLKNALPESLILCAADKVHNLASLSGEIEEKGSLDWSKFRSYEETMWYYESVYVELSKLPNNMDLLSKYQAELKLLKGK